MFFVLALAAACDSGPRTPEQAADAVAAALAKSDLETADGRLREAILRWPAHARLRELQGDLDLERGDGIRAQAAYEKALRATPGERALQVKLARALLVQERRREMLLIAEPKPGDSDDVRAGLALLRLEARLGAPGADFREMRMAAEDVWRASATAPTPSMVDVRRRLDALALVHEAVATGREHARCRAPAVLVRPEAGTARGEVVRVGPGEKLATPGAAARVVRAGTVVEIVAGDYDEPAITWVQDDLTLRATGGRVRVRSGAASGAAWVLRGDRAVVENIEFVLAGQPASAAGLRLEGRGATVRDAVFRGEGTAILAPDAADGDVRVMRSELAARAPAGGAGVDVGSIARLVIEFSDLRGDGPGRAVRSRARDTALRYGRISGAGDVPAPLLELAGSGRIEVLGNELSLGRGAGARDFLVLGEAAVAPTALLVLGNTFYSEASGATAVRVLADASALVANNVAAGAPLTLIAGRAAQGGNIEVGEGLADPARGDFGLRPGSPAIDAAVDPATLVRGAPGVAFEYRHPRAGVRRTPVAGPDAGAHEYCLEPAAGGEAPALFRE